MNDALTIQPLSSDISLKSNKIEDDIGKYLGSVSTIMIKQSVEFVETSTSFLSLGCCKVETQNGYDIIAQDSQAPLLSLLVASEHSNWCMRNPCCCCVCTCWGLQCDCSSRRPFTMSVSVGEKTGRELMKFIRPYRSTWFPCCLQILKVESCSQYLGCVKQVASCFGLTGLRGQLEVRDDKEELLYTVSIPCRLSGCFSLNVDFDIFDPEGKKAGSIIKENSALKDLGTDADTFVIDFPAGATAINKSLILAAGILIDYLYFED